MKVGELKKELDQFSNDMEVVGYVTGLAEDSQYWGRISGVERVETTKDNTGDDTEGPAVLLS